MKLEDYLIARDKLTLIDNPAHNISLVNGTIYITRNKAPRFKAVVTIGDELTLNVTEWIDPQPPTEAKETALKNKALAFLTNFYIINKQLV
jgi:hypothetical protein